MNIDDLIDKLASVGENLLDGKVDVKVASEFNNTAGKMLKAAALQMQFLVIEQQIGTQTNRIRFMQPRLLEATTELHSRNQKSEKVTKS